MRKLIFAAILSVPCAFAARAEDTRGPAISEVKVSVKGSNVSIEARITDETGVLSATVHHRAGAGKGGEVEETAMQKNEFDDVFKATFAGSVDSEYWIDSSDLLGNASTYGSSSKAYAASGKPAGKQTTVAATEPPAWKPRPEPKQQPKAEPRAEAGAEPKPEKKPRHHREGKAQAKAAEKPVIEHRKPTSQPAAGQDFVVRMKIHSESPIGRAVLSTRAAGSTANYASSDLTHGDGDGDSYEGRIPAAVATGTVEYFIVAKDQAGVQTRQGDGDDKTPYTITFKGGPPGAGAESAAAEPPSGPFRFAHWTLFRTEPGRPILVRAQIVASADDSVPGTAVVLDRGNDGQDLDVPMTPDRTGGWGGFKAEIPAQTDGAVYYQIVACDDAGAKCAADTGGRKRWHATAVAAQPGGAVPLPIGEMSSKAPAGLTD